MESLARYINSLTPLSEEELNALLPFVRSQQLRKGEFFVRQGEVCQKIAFIERGFLRLFHEVDGKDITRDITEENTFLSAMGSYITGEPSVENVQAINDCQLWVIQKGKLESLYGQYPVFERLARKALEQFFVKHQNRIYTLIAEPAEVRYERLLQERPDVLQQVPLQYVASLLGVAQPSLSRIRKRLSTRLK